MSRTPGRITVHRGASAARLMREVTPRRWHRVVFDVPGVILGCCAAFLVIHGLRGVLATDVDNRIVAAFALLPARFALALDLEPTRVAAAYQAAVGGNPFVAQQIDFLVGDGGTRWWTLLTCALLHASWSHVGLNCLWLVAFGWAVARRLSSIRFLALFAVAVLVSSLVYLACNLTDFDLVIGASGGVSGTVGALTRFIFRPATEPGGALDDAYFRRPALSLRQTVTTRSALAFILIFCAANTLSAYLPTLGGLADGSVAWQGHIGGFLAGLLLFPLFDRKMPPPVEPTS